MSLINNHQGKLVSSKRNKRAHCTLLKQKHNQCKLGDDCDTKKPYQEYLPDTAQMGGKLAA